MDQEQEEETTTVLIERRHQLTEALFEHAYDPILYLERAVAHSDLGYPDLAAGDAYRALLLTDEVRNESFEYHDRARESLLRHSSAEGPAVLQQWRNSSRSVATQDGPLSQDSEENTLLLRLTSRTTLRCYQILSISLLLCGCLKSAYEFCNRGLAAAPDDEDLLQSKEYIQSLARRRLKVDHVDFHNLPDQGLVRREIYPWNYYGPDRFSLLSIALLNNALNQVAPKCVVQVTDLPTLHDIARPSTSDESIPTNQQLGLFARRNIAAGEIVLSEFTILTANNRLKASLCDACSAPLPPLSSPTPAVPCDECVDTLFCTTFCHDAAREGYHSAVCDADLDTLFKDPTPAETPNALYLLLLTRALAMSITQSQHPLSLPSILYLWGDFLLSTQNAVPLSPNAGPPPIWTLPFSFQSNIAMPLHVLEKMDIDVYARLADFDLWVFNTLYAKFRGVASARVATGDGRAGPEVAAVHPLWCLANHDCEPNVAWEWGGRMELKARRPIRAGEEILNHYCDVDLPVRERREWAKGSLGGWCMCERCRREAKEEDEEEERASANGLRN